MKIAKQLRRLLSLQLILTMIISMFMVQVSAEASTQNDFSIIRDRIIENITGVPYDLNNQYIASKVKQIGDWALNDYNTMNKAANRTYLWSNNQNLHYGDNYITPSMKRLQGMAKSYRMPGTPLYQNSDVANEVLNGLQFLTKNYYNENTPITNWVHAEAHLPYLMGEILVLLYDLVPKTATADKFDLIDFQRIVDSKTPDPRYSITYPGRMHEGGNLAHACNAHVVIGAVLERSSNLDMSIDGAEHLFDFVEKGSGAYEDGSFIQHQNVPYLHIYGQGITRTLGKFTFLLDNTAWELRSPKIMNVYDFIYKALLPGVINGVRAQSLMGRHGSGWDDPRDRQIINSVAPLAISGPEEQQEKITGMIKQWILGGQWNVKGIYYSSDINEIKTLTKIMDSPIPPGGKYTDLKFWASQDRLIKHKENWALELSMFSERIRSAEIINGNNLEGYHVGSGMTLIHNTNPDYYWDGYFAAVNEKRLPGTTVLKDVVSMKEANWNVARDTYVSEKSRNSNYGTDNRIIVANNNSGEHNKGYFYFNLHMYDSISNATLKLYGSNTGDSSQVPVSVAVLENDNWSDTTINWNNQPYGNLRVLDTINVGPSEKYYQWNIRDFIREDTYADGKATLVLFVPSKQGDHKLEFYSMEQEDIPEEGVTKKPVIWKNMPQNYMSEYSWVGGTTLEDQYASIGMEYSQIGYDLHGKKSWFIFDDEIVFLGTDINSADGVQVETIVDNRRLNDQNGDNLMKVNGSIKSTILGQEITNINTGRVHLAGETSSDDIGYYFPGGSDLKILREIGTGNYREDIDYVYGSTGDRSLYFMNLVLDHGVNPINESYEYVVLPSKSSSEVDTYSVSPDIEILENTKEAQGVRENTLNITGINFWNDNAKKVDIITSHQKASVTYRETDGVLTLSVSDPTQKNDEYIDIEIDKPLSSIISCDPEITVYEMGDKTKLSVYTRKALGKTFNVSFRTTESITPEVDFSGDYNIGKGNVDITTIEYDVMPNKDNIEGHIGLTDASVRPESLNELAVNIRMSLDGKFEAINGNNYEALAEVNYSSGKEYHVKIAADMKAKTYDAWIAESGLSLVKIAENYDFATNTLNIRNLGKIVLKSNSTDDYVLTNMSTLGSYPELPVIDLPFDSLADGTVRYGWAVEEINSYKRSMEIKGSYEYGNYSRHGVAKFNTKRAYPIEKAELVFKAGVLEKFDGYIDDLNIHRVNDNSWDEGTLSGSTFSGMQEVLATVSINAKEEQMYAVDITDYVVEQNQGDGIVSLGLARAGSEGNILWVSSRDHEEVSYRPRIVVEKKADSNEMLSDLSLSAGNLKPLFEKQRTSYKLTVDNSVDTTTVTATPESPIYSSLSINGREVASGEASGPITLEVGENLIEVVVTAGDGEMTKAYTVIVTREEGGSNADLSGLRLSAGTLPHGFWPSTTSYNVNVAKIVTEITVTAIADSPTYSGMTINGEDVVSGVQSSPIPLVIGNNVVEVVVTAEDGRTKTYIITINKGSGWFNQDIGNVGASGSASFDEDTITIEGSGSDIWYGSDEFHFAYKEITGDGSITARVVSQTNTHPWAKAGVMMRDTLDPNSKFAMTVMAPSNGVNYQWRNTTGGSCDFDQAGSITAPQYVKLERVGDSITSFYSMDGLSWTQIGGAQTISMNEKVLVGLAVTSHNDGVLSEAVFDNIQILTGERVLDNNANLSNLILSEGTLEPTFDPSTTSYNLTVDNAVTETTVTATTDSQVYSGLTIDGKVVASGVSSGPIALEVGDNVVDIVVTAEDGTTKTYRVIITRADIPSANVVSLYQHGNYGGYQVDFPLGNYVTADLVAYGVKENDVSSIKVTAGYKVTLYDEDNFTGNSLVLTEDTDIVKIFNDKVSSMIVEITSQSSSTATLSYLETSVGALSPNFNGNTLSYDVYVDNSVTETTIIASPTNSNYSGLTINGTAVVSGVASEAIALKVGNNPIDIMVIAEDGLTTMTYTVNVHRNPEGISTGNLLLNKPATVSNVFGGNQNWNGSKAVDGDPSTRWATNSGLEEVWLEVDFEALVTFNKTVIKEFQTHGNRVDSYKIQYWDGDNWQDAYKGGSLQAEQIDTFSDVTTTKVRLLLTDYDQSGPSIWEFEVFYQ